MRRNLEAMKWLSDDILGDGIACRDCGLILCHTPIPGLIDLCDDCYNRRHEHNLPKAPEHTDIIDYPLRTLSDGRIKNTNTGEVTEPCYESIHDFHPPLPNSNRGD